MTPFEVATERVLGDHRETEAPIQALGATAPRDVQRHGTLRLRGLVLERTYDRRSDPSAAPRLQHCDVDEPQCARAAIHRQPADRLGAALDHIEARAGKAGAMRTLLGIELQREQCVALRGSESRVYDVARARKQREQEGTVCSRDGTQR